MINDDLSKKKSPHFREKYLVLSYLNKLLIFINSKNLRTIRKLIAYENSQDYSRRFSLLFYDWNHIQSFSFSTYSVNT